MLMLHGINERLLASGVSPEKATPRELRNLSCAYCKDFFTFFVDDRSKRAVELSELFANGQIGRLQLLHSWNDAHSARQHIQGQHEVAANQFNYIITQTPNLASAIKTIFLEHTFKDSMKNAQQPCHGFRESVLIQVLDRLPFSSLCDSRIWDLLKSLSPEVHKAWCDMRKWGNFGLAARAAERCSWYTPESNRNIELGLLKSVVGYLERIEESIGREEKGE
jgi:hypothetical protein